jgi:adenine-specific DNA-methyltransferase
MMKESKKTIWGLDNPHPLSQVKTELIWEGKYDEYGNRRTVDTAGCAMPLQKIETIDEPRSRCLATGDLFNPKKAHPDDFRNMLIWGDNKLVMASLLKDFKGKIDLIYIDPPFDVGADFTMDVPVGESDETVHKDQSTLEMVAYRDMWGKGTDSYLHMMFERLSLMKELLSSSGSIFVHCDWHVDSYMRCLLDDVFGPDLLVNSIVWKRKGGSANPLNRLGTVTDAILWYSKTSGWRLNPILDRESEDVKVYIAERFVHRDEHGRIYMRSPLVSPNPRPNLTYEYKGYKPPKNGWAISIEKMRQWDEQGRLYFPPSKAQRIYRKIFLDEYQGQPIQNLWTDIFVINPVAKERLFYDTQKPEALLERVLRLSTGEGDLVADFFPGSGTTGAVAEKLGRRWIMCDLGRFAIHTSRKRMIEMQRKLHEEGKPYRAFGVYNLGRYERQWWQKAQLNGADGEHRKVVLGFYKAEVLPNPIGPLHGRKGRAFVHVDAIDGILTRDEVRKVAVAAREAGAKEVHCLAWEFEMDLRMICHELEASEGVQIRLIPIPREIMEKNRKEPPPFLEVAMLEAEPVYHSEGKDRFVDIKLTKFMPSLAEVPTKELQALRERAVKSGFDFIDFWAVDFDWHDGKPFEHHWQDYRTRKDRSLKTVSDAKYGKYPKPGIYAACVKVVDVFGCDTSITVKVDTRE